MKQTNSHRVVNRALERVEIFETRVEGFHTLRRSVAHIVFD
ncbi:hypothetical protein [Nocardioides sp. Leaf374]|nr:hypothetical protein [Nocardioides sp. Leaf374]